MNFPEPTNNYTVLLIVCKRSLVQDRTKIFSMDRTLQDMEDAEHDCTDTLNAKFMT